MVNFTCVWHQITVDFWEFEILSVFFSENIFVRYLIFCKNERNILEFVTNGICHNFRNTVC